MKLIALLIVAVVAVQVSAVPTETDLGAAVKNFLVKLQQSIPCGLEDGQSLGSYIMSKTGGKPVEYNAPDIQ